MPLGPFFCYGLGPCLVCCGGVFRFLRRGPLPRPLAPATLAALCFRLFARVSAPLPLRSLSPLSPAVAWLRSALRILTPAPGRPGTGLVDEEEGMSYTETRKTAEAFC